MKRSTIKFVILSLLFALVMPAAILFVACDTNPPATCKLVYVIGGEKYKEVDVAKHSSVSSERAAELFGETKTGFSLDGWYADREKTREFEGVTDITSKVFLYGDWVRNRYTLTYVFGNGNDDLVLPLEYEQIIPSEDDPERTAYDFDGWDTEIPETMPAHDLIITATWTPIEYDITFDENGGEEVEDVKYTIESPTFVLPSTTKTGWVFDGWFDGTTKYEQVELGSYGDLNLVAEWHLDSFVIRYEVDGETYAEQTYEYGEAVVLPDAPQKTGYTFGGWDTEIPETMPAHDILARATWTANEYSVVFKGNQPADAPYDIDPQQDVVQNFVYGTAQDLTANSFVLAGYEFDSWNTAADGSGTKYDNGQNVVNLASTEGAQFELYAQWNIRNFTLTIVDNAGEHSMPYDIKTHIEAPAGASKTGYDFEYWIVTSGTGTWAEMIGAHIETGDPADNMYGDVTLEAQYAVCSYVMTFVVDGVTVSSQEYDYDASVTAPDDPIKEGYTFVGWTPDAPETMPAHDETCVAQWQINNWTMTYLVDGEVYDTQHYDYGASVVAPADPTKEGWEFAGWTPAVPATMPDNDETVEAEFVQYTLEIVRSHDVADVNVQAPTPQQSGTVFTLEYDPETLYLGYDWLGWWDGETKLSENASYEYVMPAANTTIVAKFAVKTEMSKFVFESSTSYVKITGIQEEYKTTGDHESTYEIIVPSYVNEIANGAFKGLEELKLLQIAFFGRSADSSVFDYEYDGIWQYYFKIDDYAEYQALDDEIYYKYYFYTGSGDERVYYNYALPRSLKTLRIPQNVVAPNQWAFDDSKGKTTIENIQYCGSIENWCTLNFNVQSKNPMYPDVTINFYYLDGENFVLLTELEIPTSVRDSSGPNALRQNMFVGFASLTKLTIPVGVQKLGSQAFKNCINLETIIIKETGFSRSADGIPANCFYGCNNLTSVYFAGSESQWTALSSKIKSNFNGATVYFYYNEVVPTTVGNYWTYDQNHEIVTLKLRSITFDSNGGSDVEPLIAEAGTDIQDMFPEDPTKEGWEFEGWYADQELTIQYEFDTMPDENIVVYAKWFEV